MPARNTPSSPAERIEAAAQGGDPNQGQSWKQCEIPEDQRPF